MQLLEKLFGLRNKPLMEGSIAMPAVNPTHYTQSLVDVGPSHLSTHNRRVPLMRSDFRRLERNKYAPWGRGDLSGLPQ